MAFDDKGNLSDTIERAKVYVVVKEGDPVRVRTDGVFDIEMYSPFNIGDYVAGKSNNYNSSIIAVSIPPNDVAQYNHSIVGRIIGKKTDKIAKVLV
tara:strand:- start:607 stop:894 length:288 start_codon:yes stop_codon:yes gene_type:complete